MNFNAIMAELRNKIDATREKIDKIFAKSNPNVAPNHSDVPVDEHNPELGHQEELRTTKTGQKLVPTINSTGKELDTSVNVTPISLEHSTLERQSLVTDEYSVLLAKKETANSRPQDSKKIKEELDSNRIQYFEYLLSIVEDSQFYDEISRQRPPFIKSFIAYLQSIIESLNRDFSSESPEYQNMYLEEIDNYQKRIQLAEASLNALYQMQEEFVFVDPFEQKKNRIIFGSVEYPSSKVLFKEDLLKDIPQAYYLHVLELLEGLQTENKVVIEAYKGDNLKGLKKVKKGGTGIRLVFRTLTPNLVYVDMILQKKCTNNHVYENKLDSRKKRLDEDYFRVLTRIRNNDNVEELIEENAKILGEIEKILIGGSYLPDDQMDPTVQLEEPESIELVTTGRRIG